MQNSLTAPTLTPKAMQINKKISEKTVTVIGTATFRKPFAILEGTLSETGVLTIASIKTDIFSDPTTTITKGKISQGTKFNLIPSKAQREIDMIIEMSSSVAPVKAIPKRE